MTGKGKTNAMRLLDQAGLDYTLLTYPYDPLDLSGLKAAASLGLPASQVYKTIVARSDKGSLFVLCLAVDKTVDLKQLARLAGHKQLALLDSRELPALTGYQRGGCSPLAMKKTYPVYFDQAALGQQQIAINAGRRGWQLLVSPGDLINLLGALVAPVAQQPSS